jgi:hypothetical protein
MKLNTVMVILKGLAYVTIGFFTPFIAALSQWVNASPPQWPEQISWVGVIIPNSIIGAASALLAFLSNSYSTYKKERDTVEQPEPMKPNPPTP